jgi:enolase
MESGDQKEIDDALCLLGGDRKATIGGNTALAVSSTVARAHAAEAGIPLWRYLREMSHIESFPSPYPRPFVNLLNGAAHTGNAKLFQEYTIVPESASLHDALAVVERVRAALETLMEKRFPHTPLGDEGGWALSGTDPLEPFALLQEAADGQPCVFALDAAATESAYTDDERTRLYTDMARKFPLRFLEDPYGEEAFGLFAQLAQQLPDVTLIGDDLTTTNPLRIAQAHEDRSIRGVIIKPNQIGTVSEALGAARAARGYGWSVIASHRSGETTDSFIADFAYSIGADGIKVGVSTQKERAAKYDRLRVIETE